MPLIKREIFFSARWLQNVIIMSGNISVVLNSIEINIERYNPLCHLLESGTEAPIKAN